MNVGQVVMAQAQRGRILAKQETFVARHIAKQTGADERKAAAQAKRDRRAAKRLQDAG